MSILPWDNLQDYVHDWMKGLQEIVDSIAPDPGEDNSMLPLASLPYKFDCTFYHTINTRSIIDGYEAWDKGYGYQPWLYAFRLNLMNNQLRVVNQQWLGAKVGMGSPDRWGYLTNEDLETINAAGKAIIEGTPIIVDNSYPAEVIKTSGGNYGNISFYPLNHNTSDIKYKFPTKDPNTTKDTGDSSITCVTTELPVFDENDGYWKPDYWGIYQTGGSGPNYSVYSKLIVVYESDTEALRTVNTISPYNTNNDIINYTKAGSEYKLYYGDNYLVYALNSSKIYNYQDLFTGTNQATTAISGWHPADPPIKTPTYQEVKHEDDPPIDDDIEVDMPLNDAAYGAGLSHYYVTTVGSPVLEDISAAMSSWDIVNTGKDLYRNLISCRITKVGPIPSESSTFVIYGEELQYNGSPITITKITGNPSMDLGEYEILPKFNDFRDYAPFTKIEMFIPYCGWVSLPSHCMSSKDKPKIITGTLLCDIIAGTCKAVIKCNDTVVAEASGFTAIDVPFTGENVGMKMAGIASSITSYGNQAAKTVGSVASGAMTGGAGAGAALAGGLVGMLGSYAQMYSAFNANYTEICGKTGDGCNVAGLGSVFIKIQRPKAGETESPYYVPANYAHTTGFMSMKQKKISECEGLIVCANVDTSGISGATARERAEIKRLLETGIYVNLPEPEPPEPPEP